MEMSQQFCAGSVMRSGVIGRVTRFRCRREALAAPRTRCDDRDDR